MVLESRLWNINSNLNFDDKKWNCFIKQLWHGFISQFWHVLPIWAASWQTNKNPPSLIRVLAICMKKAWVLSYSLSAQRRLWSDKADAKADLSLRLAHSHFVGFIMLWLISISLYKAWNLFMQYRFDNLGCHIGWGKCLTGPCLDLWKSGCIFLVFCLGSVFLMKMPILSQN